MRHPSATLLAVAAALALPGPAAAAGGRYVFDGGTAAERSQVRQALDASSFDWSVVPVTVTIHIERGVDSEATPGEIWLDSNLLAAKRFAWATVQHEYAHQVDYFVLTPEDRAALSIVFGTPDWCYGIPGLRHEQYGCERLASTIAWAFWPSPQNALRPHGAGDEALAGSPAAVRGLIAKIIPV